ncbi:FixH family protein [Chungangia koreensis]|uniref:FixH family protein n=1 Tax=Chungangia koreensis TaxID=752657 RepID=A0ABV8X1G6_9LACT
MKRIHLLLILLLTVLLAAACGAEEKEEKSQESAPPVPISVDLQVPATAEVGQEVEVVAKVTQGEEVVTDASEVEFEIINDNSGEKTMVPAELKEDQYTAVITLEQPGSYSVTSHVTARDMHTMPTKVIEVTGDGGVAEAPNEEKHEHHHGAVIDFTDGTATAGENTPLSTTITLNETPLTEAAVRFEIWKDGSEKHDWVDTKEAGNGQYDGEYTFADRGKYFIQVHVEKDPDIHDHVTKEYNVE